MRLFLDTEFNEFGGELISMALVSEDGREWYMVLAIPQKPGAWVAEHVLPVLGQVPLDDQIAFSAGLEIFLSYFDGCEIIADWPADFEHLCNLMSDAGRRRGFIMPIECTMRLVCTPELHPTIPHNALSDARALRDWWMASVTVAA